MHLSIINPVPLPPTSVRGGEIFQPYFWKWWNGSTYVLLYPTTKLKDTSRVFNAKHERLKQTGSTVKTRTSRSTRSVEQTKAAKIETETSLQRAERLEVLSKTKEERWDEDKSRMSRVTRGVQQHKSMKDWDEDKTTTSRETRGPNQTKPKQQRLRRRQVYNEQSNSRS